jgi:hypothetical protein
MWAREDSASSIVVGYSRSLKTLKNRKPEATSAPKYRLHERWRTSAMQLVAQDDVVAHLCPGSASCLSDQLQHTRAPMSNAQLVCTRLSPLFVDRSTARENAHTEDCQSLCVLRTAGNVRAALSRCSWATRQRLSGALRGE